MRVYLTKNNLVLNTFVEEPVSRVLNVTEEQFETINTHPAHSAWQYDEEADSFTLVSLLDEQSLRNRREEECFKLIDTKSKLWWDNLSQDTYTEISNWYKAWLNVTETKQIPKLPEIFNK